MEFFRSKLWASILLLVTYPLFLGGSFLLWAVSASSNFTGTGLYDRFVYVPLMVAAALSVVATGVIWRGFAVDGKGVRGILSLLGFLPCLITVFLFIATLASQ
jgi:ABC-type sugar transport system permease subunit